MVGFGLVWVGGHLRISVALAATLAGSVGHCQGKYLVDTKEDMNVWM